MLVGFAAALAAVELEEAAAAAPLAPLPPPAQQQQQQHAPEPWAAAHNAAAGPSSSGSSGKRVVAIHTGAARVAGVGFSSPAWVEGRLWVYEDGTMGFLWLDDFEFLVDFARL